MQISKIIILTAPEYIHDPAMFPSLGVASITSYLRNNGYDIGQMDLRRSMSIKKLYEVYECMNDAARVKKFMIDGSDLYFNKIFKTIIYKKLLNKADIVLFSVNELSRQTIAFMLVLAKCLKGMNRSVVTVFGGEFDEFIAYVYNSFLFLNNAGVVDFLIRGYGEIPLLKLLESLRHDNENYANIEGLVYVQNAKVCANKKVLRNWVFPKPDFTGLSMRDYSLLQTRSYNLLKFAPKRIFKNSFILPVSFIRGCPHECAFCAEHSTSPTVTFESLSPKNAVALLEDLSNKYKTNLFFFINTAINISTSYVNEFCDEILSKKLNILWSDCVSFKNLDRETLLKMRKAGAVRLVFGCESGSQKVLDYINKGYSISHAYDCLRWSHEAGIWNHVDIIAGLPYEEGDDIDKTVQLLSQNNEFIDEVSVNPFFLVGEACLMGKHPQRYGLTNIRKETNGFLSRTESICDFSPLVNYKFDELYGKKWEDKEKQILNSHKAILNICKDKHVYDMLYYHEQMLVLFLLYQVLGEKDLVRKQFDIYKKKLQKDARLKKILDLQYIISSMRNISSFRDAAKKFFRYNKAVFSFLMPE